MSVGQLFRTLVSSILPRRKQDTSHLPGPAKNWLYPSQRLITDRNDSIAYAKAFVRDIEYGLDHNDKKIWKSAFEELKLFLKQHPQEIRQAAVKEAQLLSQKWAKMISPGWHKISHNFFKINGMEIHLAELARVLSAEAQSAGPKTDPQKPKTPSPISGSPSSPAPA